MGVEHTEVVWQLKNGEIPVNYNWNRREDPCRPVIVEPSPEQIQDLVLVCEALRDGKHGISHLPTTEEELRYIDALQRFGVDRVTVGIYTGENGNEVDRRLKKLLEVMNGDYPNVTPIVLCLASEESISWVANCREKNPNLNAIVFMGTSPQRLLVQGWKKEQVLRQLGWAVREVVNKGIGVIGGTEHTTQTPPDFWREIIQTQVENGASAICIADTVGIARAPGVEAIVKFTRDVLDELGLENIPIEWHGHRDLGNATENAKVAIANGATRIHTVPWGIGERAGNTPLETVVLNAVEIMLENGQVEDVPWKLKHLWKTLVIYSQITSEPIPTHGAFGSNAFKTSLGIHTDAMAKALHIAQRALELGETEIAREMMEMQRKVYSASDPQMFGRDHEVYVNHWSGRSTIRLLAANLGFDPSLVTDKEADAIIHYARQKGERLTEKEFVQLLSIER